MNIFTKFLQISTSVIQKRDYKLDQYAIDLIKHDFSGYLELIKGNNYIPNKLVQSEFDKQILFFIDEGKWDEIEKAVNHINFKITTKQALLIFKNLSSDEYKIEIEDKDLTFDNLEKKVSFYFNKRCRYTIQGKLKEQLITHGSLNEFQDSLFDSFNNVLLTTSKKNESSYTKLKKQKKILELLHIYLLLDNDQFKKISMNKYLKMGELLKNSIEELDYDRYKNFSKRMVVENFIENRNHIYKVEVGNMNNKSKVQFLGKVASKVAKEQLEVEFKEKLSKEYLPKSSLDVIDKIQNKYEAILKSNPEDVVTKKVDKIIKEELPNVINKYLSIAEEYKKTMTNSQGKNAEDLLLESLNSINGILTTDFEIIQKDNLTDLSATNRFLKKITL